MGGLSPLPAATPVTSELGLLTGSAPGVISERMQDVVRDFQRLRAHFANASEPDSEWALNRLIVTLVREGPMRLMALAAASQCDSSTVSRQVGTLVAKGYIERLRDPDDGRACLLKPTLAAHERYRKSLDVRAAREEDVLGAWSDSDRVRFAELLTKYSEDFARTTWPNSVRRDGAASCRFRSAQAEDSAADD